MTPTFLAWTKIVVLGADLGTLRGGRRRFWEIMTLVLAMWIPACVNLGLILTFQEPLNVQFRWEEGGSEGRPRSPPSWYSVTLLCL